MHLAEDSLTRNSLINTMNQKKSKESTYIMIQKQRGSELNGFGVPPGRIRSALKRESVSTVVVVTAFYLGTATSFFLYCLYYRGIWRGKVKGIFRKDGRRVASKKICATSLEQVKNRALMMEQLPRKTWVPFAISLFCCTFLQNTTRAQSPGKLQHDHHCKNTCYQFKDFTVLSDLPTSTHRNPPADKAQITRQAGLSNNKTHTGCSIQIVLMALSPLSYLHSMESTPPETLYKRKLGPKIAQ